MTLASCRHTAILVDGNLLENIDILTKPDENLALIMKDGKIYKNTIR